MTLHDVRHYYGDELELREREEEEERERKRRLEEIKEKKEKLEKEDRKKKEEEEEREKAAEKLAKEIEKAKAEAEKIERENIEREEREVEEGTMTIDPALLMSKEDYEKEQRRLAQEAEDKAELERLKLEGKRLEIESAKKRLKERDNVKFTGDVGDVGSGIGNLIFLGVAAFIMFKVFSGSSFASAGSLSSVEYDSNNWRSLTEQEIQNIRNLTR